MSRSALLSLVARAVVRYRRALPLVVLAITALMCMSRPALAAIAFVQEAATTPQTPLSTVTLSFDGAQNAGDLIVVAIGWSDGTSTVSSVTDSSGNSYALAIGPTRYSGTASQSIYYAKNIAAAGANTVTVSFSAAVQYPDVRIAEYSGLDGISPLDVTAGSANSSTSMDSGGAATTNANDLLVGASYVSGGTQGPGAGFTQRVIS